jgi:hypothetical protein
MVGRVRAKPHQCRLTLVGSQSFSTLEADDVRRSAGNIRLELKVTTALGAGFA